MVFGQFSATKLVKDFNKRKAFWKKVHKFYSNMTISTAVGSFPLTFIIGFE